MTEQAEANLAPVTGNARIEVLDILRGVAILGIFYVNVPYMAAPVWQFSSDIRSIGWSIADREAWAVINIFVAGSQRCLLQFLFGAGMMIAARKAMRPDGPVAVADLYYRRNLWLLAFGLFDVFFLLWPGDILHVYALAALFLFPFRGVPVRWLLAIGLGWAVMTSAGIPQNGMREYISRTELVHRVEAAEVRKDAGATLTPPEGQALADWQKLLRQKPDAELRKRIAQEREAHSGRYIPYAQEAWSYWNYHVEGWLIWDVIEAFCTMLLGVALWNWGIIQGKRSTRFYWTLLIASYGFGIGVRTVGIVETFSFLPGPRVLWVFGEYARLAIGLGHLAAVNLAVRSKSGVMLLTPFRQVGRMAFSLYFLQQLIGMYILFAPFGFNLWGRFGWAQMAAISTAGIAVQLVIANLWLRSFASGPLEWFWRSLTYMQRQPLLRKVRSSPLEASANQAAFRPFERL